MIGDFTNFFDSLDHQYLKQRWGDLIESVQLPPDHYAVYKNITRYSTWELDDLLELNDLSDVKGKIRKLNEKKVVLTKEQYKANRKHIKKNSVSYGIPQGSPISAVLANIYMLDADALIYQAVMKCKGFYMRYSDDFIVVLPEENQIDTFKSIIDIINAIPGLKLEIGKHSFSR